MHNNFLAFIILKDDIHTLMKNGKWLKPPHPGGHLTRDMGRVEPVFFYDTVNCTPTNCEIE